MPTLKIPFKPGVYKDDSPLEAKGYWIDLDKCRFVRGKVETIYGQEYASTSTLLGVARGGIAYADNSRNPYAAFGTHLRLYAMDVDGNITDVTPVTSRTQGVSMRFTTISAASTVSLIYTAHGMAADQKFTLDAASPTTVGGVVLDGTYVVTASADADNLTYVAASAATSSAGPTASTVNISVFLSPGQADGLGGLGYGTGGYGSGGYGGSSSGYTLYPRTWALSNWGQNLIANPRGGGIYEWAPNTTNSELVTNGTFTGGATAFALGAGFAYGTNNIVATAASSSVTQSVSTPVAAHLLVGVDMSSWTTGAVTVSYNNTTAIASFASNNTWRGTVFSSGGGAHTLSITGTNLSATFDNLTVKVLTTADAILNAPTAVTCSFVTSERILVACGCADTNANFDALRVRWTDTQNNQTWTAAATNLAGAYTLTNGSHIVRGVPGNRENIILTDTAVYAMRFNPDPAIVYSFPEIGSGCGLIGPNAVAQVGGIFYWMDPSCGFWAYGGAYPEPLRCTLGRDVTDNMAFVQKDKVYAFPVTQSGRMELWWLYPDGRDGTECSRYVSYAITESQEIGYPVWFNGTFDRTTWVNSGIFQYPLAVSSGGRVFFQEKGFSDNGGARTWSATSGYFDLSDDGKQMRYKSIQPDVEDQQGGYSITINTKIRNGSGILTRAFGPYSVLSTSGAVDVRANGEESQLVFGGTASPAFFRMGAFRHEIEPSGRTR